MRALPIIAVLFALCAVSCRTRKQVIESETATAVSYIDTTVTVTDAVTRTLTETDTTKTAGTTESRGVVEFVDGGGSVSIDTAGNVTLNGVKRINGERLASASIENGVTRYRADVDTHSEQHNGIYTDQQQTTRQTTEQKWHDSPFARIGVSVCIAVLIWLYLRRRLSK